MKNYPPSTFDDCKSILLEACDHIQDPNALAWSIIDNKSEQPVTFAIATAINRMVGKRIAHIEFKRIDLVLADKCLLDAGIPIAYFEAKAVYLTDFEQKRIDKKDWYLGKCILDDIEKLTNKIPDFSSTLGYAGLFYLYELTDSSRMLKYGNRAIPPIAQAFDGMKELARPARLEHIKEIDCGIADSTHVKVHVCLFVP